MSFHTLVSERVKVIFLQSALLYVSNTSGTKNYILNNMHKIGKEVKKKILCTLLDNKTI